MSETETADIDEMLDVKICDCAPETDVSNASATRAEDGESVSFFRAEPHPSPRKTLEERMNDLYEEFKADTTITLGNIRDVAFRTAAIKGRWCSRLMAERVRCRRLKETLDALVEELGKMVDGKVKAVSYLGARQNRDSVIASNEEVKRLKTEMYESKQMQDYLTMIYESIGDLGYVVKNSLDALSLERGL